MADKEEQKEEKEEPLCLGRDRVPILRSHVRKLATRRWDAHMIGSHYGVSHDTINRYFASDIKECRQANTAMILDALLDEAINKRDKKCLIRLADRFVFKTQNDKLKIEDVSKKTAPNQDELYNKIKQLMEEGKEWNHTSDTLSPSQSPCVQSPSLTGLLKQESKTTADLSQASNQTSTKSNENT